MKKQGRFRIVAAGCFLAALIVAAVAVYGDGHLTRFVEWGSPQYIEEGSCTPETLGRQVHTYRAAWFGLGPPPRTELCHCDGVNWCNGSGEECWTFSVEPPGPPSHLVVPK